MPWADLISRIEDVLVVVALVGAVWSAVAFIRKLGADREAARLAKLTTWRKAAVQAMISTSPDFLTCRQITERLRSSSFEQSFDIRKDDLTDQTVRLLLLDLVRDGIILQVFNDYYGLNQFRQDPTAFVMADSARANIAFRRAFELILKYPGHHSDESLFEELGPESGLGKGDFNLALSDLATRKVAEKNDGGRWVPATHAKGSP